MKSFTLFAITFSTVAEAYAINLARDAALYHYVPVDYDYGFDSRVTANLTFGTATDADPIKVVLDSGSSNFWVWGPGAIINYGSPYLFVPGPCNETVPTEYDSSTSSTGIVSDHGSTYAYAGNNKIVSGTQYVNDTLTASGGNTISNIQFAMETSGLIKVADNGSCLGTPYDKGIMGLSPYTNTTAGPSFRQNLFDEGQIQSKTMAMWFDEQPDSQGRYTGGTLFGAIDKSKFTGPLVKLENVVADYEIGFYVQKPLISMNGQTFNTSLDTTCLIDSGAHGDNFPFPSSGDELAQFYNASGNQLMDYSGLVAYNGPCENIPSNLTIGLTFPSAQGNESITIEMPVRNYARGALVFNVADQGKVCPLNLEAGGCIFGAPFSTAAFLGVNDADNSIFLAQGGISEQGSGLDLTSLVQIGEGQSFDTV